MDIKVDKLTGDELNRRDVSSWPIWEKEVSEFDWFYDAEEQCYLLKGKVEVTTEDGKTVTFEKGDFVTFPKGLSCRWKIKEAVSKHYNFR